MLPKTFLMILYGLLWTLLWYLIIHSCILYYLTFLEGFLSNHMALEMSPLAPDLPCSIVRGPLGSQVDLNGFSMVVCASQRPVLAIQGHSGAARLFLIWTCLYRNSFLFCKYLPPPPSNRTEMVLYLSFLKKKAVLNTVPRFLLYLTNTRGQFFSGAMYLNFNPPIIRYPRGAPKMPFSTTQIKAVTLTECWS